MSTRLWFIFGIETVVLGWQLREQPLTAFSVILAFWFGLGIGWWIMNLMLQYLGRKWDGYER